MMKPEDILAEPLGRHRASLAKGLKTSDEPRIVRDGGDQGAGLIRGFSVITRGEALGHEMWIDEQFLDDTVAAMQAAGEKGLKVRFTHPSLSSDGFGKLLGRVKNGSREGDQVFGDLHFSAAAHEAPDGDLAKYVMDLAENDPDLFGASIVFQHDRPAERAFTEQYSAEEEWTDGDGDRRKGKRFKSPDKKNTKNFQHARLGELMATDVVDDPAANPSGMFHRGNVLVEEASALAAFALNLPGAERPKLAALDMDPDRVASFAKRFLDQHGFTIVRKDDAAMSKETSTPNAPAPTAAELRAEAAAESRKFTARFGANGATWYGEGISYEAALEKHADAQAEQIKQLQTEKKELADQLAALDRGEPAPAGANDPEDKGGKKSLASLIKVPGGKK